MRWHKCKGLTLVCCRWRCRNWSIYVMMMMSECCMCQSLYGHEAQSTNMCNVKSFKQETLLSFSHLHIWWAQTSITSKSRMLHMQNEQNVQNTWKQHQINIICSTVFLWRKIGPRFDTRHIKIPLNEVFEQGQSSREVASCISKSFSSEIDTTDQSQ